MEKKLIKPMKHSKNQNFIFIKQLQNPETHYKAIISILFNKNLLNNNQDQLRWDEKQADHQDAVHCILWLIEKSIT
jgi:hypothetical protein